MNLIVRHTSYFTKYLSNSQLTKNYQYVTIFSMKDSLSVEKIQDDLKTEFIGKNIIHFDKIDSTMNYAKKIAEEGCPEGTVVIAEQQTKGHGRFNRMWISDRGGLYFSIILKPELTISKLPLLTLVASAIVAETISKLYSLKPETKWPNDVLINGRKICGILAESVLEIDKLKYVVIGIGINVNNRVASKIEGIEATSIKKELGKKVSRIDLMKVLLEEFEKEYNLNSSFLYL